MLLLQLSERCKWHWKCYLVLNPQTVSTIFQMWLAFYPNPSLSLMFQHGQFPFTEEAITLKKDSSSKTYVDLIVMQRSCSSFLVSVNLVSPAFADAIIPALLTKESVKVDFPWSTWAITDMLRMLFFLSMIPRIWKEQVILLKGYIFRSPINIVL